MLGGHLLVGGVTFISPREFKRTAIVSPVDCFMIGDSQPKDTDPPSYSSSCWWPYACLDPNNSLAQGYEGVQMKRHRARGVMVFTDGHSEARKDQYINPLRDPAFGDARGLINSKYWDPLKRAGDQ